MLVNCVTHSAQIYNTNICICVDRQTQQKKNRNSVLINLRLLCRWLFTAELYSFNIVLYSILSRSIVFHVNFCFNCNVMFIDIIGLLFFVVNKQCFDHYHFAWLLSNKFVNRQKMIDENICSSIRMNSQYCLGFFGRIVPDLREILKNNQCSSFFWLENKKWSYFEFVFKSGSWQSNSMWLNFVFFFLKFKCVCTWT